MSLRKSLIALLAANPHFKATVVVMKHQNLMLKAAISLLLIIVEKK